MKRRSGLDQKQKFVAVMSVCIRKALVILLDNQCLFCVSIYVRKILAATYMEEKLLCRF